MAGRNFGFLRRRSTLGLRERVRLGLEVDHVRVTPAAPKPEGADDRKQEDWK